MEFTNNANEKKILFILTHNGIFISTVPFSKLFYLDFLARRLYDALRNDKAGGEKNTRQNPQRYSGKKALFYANHLSISYLISGDLHCVLWPCIIQSYVLAPRRSLYTKHSSVTTAAIDSIFSFLLGQNKRAQETTKIKVTHTKE